MSDALKYDNEKPRVSLIPTRPLLDLADVLTFGAKKYDAHNWRKGMQWSRLLDASFRHIIAFNSGEDTDQESGLPHLAHAACCLFFLLEYQRAHPELDDRPTSKKHAKSTCIKD